MSKTVKAIPDDYQGATPYLTVKGAASAIDFYKKAFGAVEIVRLDPGGHVIHAELRISRAPIMLSEEMPDYGALSPASIGGSGSSSVIFVEDVDAFVARAVAAGCTLQMPVADQFWGDRMGALKDPFGHNWMFSTHLEDVTPEQLPARAAAAMGKGQAPCN